MDVYDEQILNQINCALAIERDRHKEAFLNKPLEDQRLFFETRAKRALSSYDLDQTKKEELLEEIQPRIQEFLVCFNDSKDYDVHAKTWRPWLDQKRKSSIAWRYSRRYFDYLVGIKKWNGTTADSIDVSTDKILGFCGDPKSNKDFAVKGLVVGDIQSGKTANYTALINKAVDAGYKVIIILTGTTNDLRAQTQKRIDKEVNGLKTDFDDNYDFENEDPDYGVAKIDPSLETLSFLTNASQDGDIKKNGINIQITNTSSCVMAVLKKNPGSLNNLIEFFEKNLATRRDPDHKMPYPVLLIDDEADLASVNTKNSTKADEATITNRLIRKFLFEKCHKVTYVGYTATPFANIFITPRSYFASNECDDIYPDDFIVTLDTPKDYCGPKQYFGIDRNTQYDDSSVRTDLVVKIPEDDVNEFSGAFDDSVPSKDQKCIAIPDSLREAIKCFLISCGAKYARGIIENYTMLINVDVKVIFNRSLRDNVKEVFENICRNFKNDLETRQEFKQYWLKEFKPVSEKKFVEWGMSFKDNWTDVERGILKVISWVNQNSIKLIAGTNDSDVLDYSKTKHGVFVCVGGQKLSRGLTLEGLSVSYYARNTQYMDSLLQMGRWFGYRPGWLDLCRVFTTQNVVNNYIDAAIATEGFKQQIQEMDEENATPDNFGLRVLASSKKFLPTARNKMRKAQLDVITYSGRLSQTLDFKPAERENNLNLVQRFAKQHSSRLTSRAGFSGLIYKNIPVEDVKSLLKGHKGPTSLINDWLYYINKANDYGELKNWTVIFSSTKNDDKYGQNGKTIDIDGHFIKKPYRSLRLGINPDGDVLSVRALTSPGDYVGYFPETFTPNPNGYNYDEIKDYYKPTDCILVIYVFDLKKRDENGVQGTLLENGKNTVGFGIWFPRSNYLTDEFWYRNLIDQNNDLKDSDASLSDGDED